MYQNGAFSADRCCKRLSPFDKRLHDSEIIWAVEKQFVVTHCNNVPRKFICINNDGFLPSVRLIQAMVMKVLWINHSSLTVKGSTLVNAKAVQNAARWPVFELGQLPAHFHQLSRCSVHQRERAARYSVFLFTETFMVFENYWGM